MFKVSHKGNFNNTISYIKNVTDKSKFKDAKVVAEACLEALKENTPKDTGLTADSWYYTIQKNKDGIDLLFSNSNIQNGVNVVLLIDYGHATPNGQWIEGKNFVSPTVRNTYLEAIDKKWKEMKKL